MTARSWPGRRRDAQAWREADPNHAAAPGKPRVDPHIERSLDEALEGTFPASDPVAFPLRSD